MGRFLALGLAVALLAGCVSGAQTSTVPQGATSAQAHNRSGSWMKPEGSSEDLIYVSSPDYYQPSSESAVYVYSYPTGTLVGTLTGFNLVGGLCSDASGNVWITDAVSYQTGGYVYEYAHGATTPTVTLTDQGEPIDCSVEPSSGNLAVANYASIAVYPNASDAPTYYSTRPAHEADNNFISYDGSGNLYAAPFKHHPVWLPSGASTVRKFYIHPKEPHGGFDWDGKYFTVLIRNTINRYTPSGGHSHSPVGSVSLSGPTIYWDYYSIKDSKLAIAQESGGGNVYVYDYPKGGYPTLTISGVRSPLGIAISVAPSHPRHK